MLHLDMIANAIVFRCSRSIIQIQIYNKNNMIARGTDFIFYKSGQMNVLRDRSLWC
jgi:hypothetical protein